MKKNSEGPATNADIHGRLEALDQSIRSVEGRLRAVERRLSYDSYTSKEKGAEHGILPEYDIHDEIEGLSNRVAILAGSLEEIKNERTANRIDEIEHKVESIRTGLAGLVETSGDLGQKLDRLSESERRLERLENANKITIGKIKVPLELSGLVAAFVLLATGYLIFANKWNIIRSSYYPVTIGIIFGAVVIAKFLITNKDAF